MGRTLVVYYSRTGYTKRIAEEIAGKLSADLCPVQAKTPRHGVLGYLRSGFEAAMGRLPALEPLPRDPARYDLVVVGTPIWNWNLSSPMRAFATTYGPLLKRTAYFCTMGGSGAERAFGALARISGKTPVATLALTDRQIDTGRYGQEVDRFVGSIRT